MIQTVEKEPLTIDEKIEAAIELTGPSLVGALCKLCYVFNCPPSDWPELTKKMQLALLVHLYVHISGEDVLTFRAKDCTEYGFEDVDF